MKTLGGLSATECESVFGALHQIGAVPSDVRSSLVKEPPASYRSRLVGQDSVDEHHTLIDLHHQVHSCRTIYTHVIGHTST